MEEQSKNLFLKAKLVLKFHVHIMRSNSVQIQLIFIYIGVLIRGKKNINCHLKLIWFLIVSTIMVVVYDKGASIFLNFFYLNSIQHNICISYSSETLEEKRSIYFFKKIPSLKQKSSIFGKLEYTFKCIKIKDITIHLKEVYETPFS